MSNTSVSASSQRVFFEGLASGIAGTVLIGASALYLLRRSRVLNMDSTEAPMSALGPLAPALTSALDWASANLGLSLPVFSAIGLLFLFSLFSLRARVIGGAPVEAVAQAEHLADTWTALFFGVGVIWTAIGMRGALLFALGDPTGVREAGAFALLQRMVDGGILLALSTTIFGGIGGYLMRVLKTLTVGVRLKRYYQRAAGEAARDNTRMLNETLLRIEQRMDQLTSVNGPAPVPDPCADPAVVMTAANVERGTVASSDALSDKRRAPTERPVPEPAHRCQPEPTSSLS